MSMNVFLSLSLPGACAGGAAAVHRPIRVQLHASALALPVCVFARRRCIFQ